MINPVVCQDLTTMSEKAVVNKYVSVKRVIDNKFVEFNFAIGDPTLFVELILPVAAYAEFCQANDVIEMSAEQCQLLESEAARWRYGKDSGQD